MADLTLTRSIIELTFIHNFEKNKFLELFDLLEKKTESILGCYQTFADGREYVEAYIDAFTNSLQTQLVIDDSAAKLVANLDGYSTIENWISENKNDPMYVNEFSKLLMGFNKQHDSKDVIEQLIAEIKRTDEREKLFISRNLNVSSEMRYTHLYYYNSVKNISRVSKEVAKYFLKYLWNSKYNLKDLELSKSALATIEEDIEKYNLNENDSSFFTYIVFPVMKLEINEFLRLNKNITGPLLKECTNCRKLIWPDQCRTIKNFYLKKYCSPNCRKQDHVKTVKPKGYMKEYQRARRANGKK